ncbi:hypothetical protein NQ317_012525 [Molorchus minor]|uniref:DRBM domain-containing protein n=1 Tax=Molorchus minor TaxID=1323400 RepID=A0ABQ9K3M1_9CUCU|nr:hypothetical protein NQ317_012525 [Molorchus minor]
MYFINFLSFFTLVTYATSTFTTIEEIKHNFGSKHCIQGSFSTISINSAESNLLIEDNESTYLINNKSSTESRYEKSTLSKLHELAQYNDLKYFFKLDKEEHNLANIALENTEYGTPPAVSDKEHNKDTSTPTVLLNNLGAKFGLKITYYLMNKDKKAILNGNNMIIDGQFKKSYLQKLNDSIYADNHLLLRKDESQSKGPFTVMVEVGDLSFYGISYTIQSARHEAASKAVNGLIKQIQDGSLACAKEDWKEECRKAKINIKSPISLVCEAATLRELDIEFEIIKEDGPPHKRIFVTQCRLGHLITTGEGNSKKESKRVAAENMLNRMSELPKVPQEVLTKNILKENNKNKKKKKNKVIKTNFDMINMHIENLIDSVVESNPFGDMKSGKKFCKFFFEKDGKLLDSSKGPKPKKSGSKSSQDKILELSNLLKFEIQFMDINGNKEYYSLLSLHINPHHICLGNGPSMKMARNDAARSGLNLLKDIPFDSYFTDKKYTVLESEVKERIQLLLNQELSKEKS